MRKFDTKVQDLMKFIKWKSLIITCLACLLPILLGIALWDKLPDTVAIHFNINNEPDSFASKGFAVFGIPILMTILHLICCVVNDVNVYKHGKNKEIKTVTIWIIPIVTAWVQIVILGYALGYNIDMRKSAVLIIILVLIIVYGAKKITTKKGEK